MQQWSVPETIEGTTLRLDTQVEHNRAEMPLW